MRLLLIFCCLISPFLGLSQQAFHPGYIVTVEGDTVRGLVSIKNNYQTCYLKAGGKKLGYGVNVGCSICIVVGVTIFSI